MIEWKLTQVAQGGQQCVTLLVREWLRERPDDDVLASFGIIGKEDGTEPAVAETGSNLKRTERARMRVQVKRTGRIFPGQWWTSSVHARGCEGAVGS